MVSWKLNQGRNQNQLIFFFHKDNNTPSNNNRVKRNDLIDCLDVYKRRNPTLSKFGAKLTSIEKINYNILFVTHVTQTSVVIVESYSCKISSAKNIHFFFIIS